jgi:hypothetical protein
MELSVMTVSVTIGFMRVKLSIRKSYRTPPNAFTIPISQNKNYDAKFIPYGTMWQPPATTNHWIGLVSAGRHDTIREDRFLRTCHF